MSALDSLPRNKVRELTAEERRARRLRQMRRANRRWRARNPEKAQAWYRHFNERREHK